MNRASASAKINLALVVGPRREEGRHEVTTVLQRVDLCDRVAVSPAERTTVRGFAPDTIVADALRGLSDATGAPGWAARIWKRIPVAAGLGGGSSDAATALRLANATLSRPLGPSELAELAGGVGADVPFFLAPGPALGEGDGSSMSPLDLPQDYWVLLLLPAHEQKSSTAAVYESNDRRAAERGYAQRHDALLAALERVRRPRDLASLPGNDLAESPLAAELLAAGAFRADVSGAGPVVYGLFHRLATAQAARRLLAGRGRSWLTVPAWYG